MRLWDIAFSNMKRRKSRVAFLLAGLGAGVATVVALFSITMTLNRNMEEKLDRFGANILISPRSEGLSLSYGGISLGGVSYNVKEISHEDLERIDLIENRGNIRVVAPKTIGVVETASSAVILAGIDVPKELTLKKWWRISGRAPDSGNEVLAGHLVAGKMGLSPGASMAINGKEMSVSGVLSETGSQDDEILFAPIATVQKLLDKEGLYSMVEVSALCKDCPVDKIVGQISRQIPGARVTAVQQVVKSKMQAVDHLVKFTVGVTAVVLFIGTLTVLVTMMSSIKERTREIGIFRALGFRKSHIIKIILLEAGVLSLMAGLLGWAFGAAIAWMALPLFAGGESGPFFSYPYLAPAAMLLALVTGLSASAYPALRAVKLAPGEALRILY